MITLVAGLRLYHGTDNGRTDGQTLATEAYLAVKAPASDITDMADSRHCQQQQLDSSCRFHVTLLIGGRICRLFSKQAEINLKKPFSGYDNASSISELKMAVENLHFARHVVACIFVLLFSCFALFNR